MKSIQDALYFDQLQKLQQHFQIFKTKVTLSDIKMKQQALESPPKKKNLRSSSLTAESVSEQNDLSAAPISLCEQGLLQ